MTIAIGAPHVRILRRAEPPIDHGPVGCSAQRKFVAARQLQSQLFELHAQHVTFQAFFLMSYWLPLFMFDALSTRKCPSAEKTRFYAKTSKKKPFVNVFSVHGTGDRHQGETERNLQTVCVLALQNDFWAVNDPASAISELGNSLPDGWISFWRETVLGKLFGADFDRHYGAGEDRICDPSFDHVMWHNHATKSCKRWHKGTPQVCDLKSSFFKIISQENCNLQVHKYLFLANNLMNLNSKLETKTFLIVLCFPNNFCQMIFETMNVWIAFRLIYLWCCIGENIFFDTDADLCFLSTMFFFVLMTLFLHFPQIQKQKMWEKFA